jgi:hypothetical protein
MLALKDYRLYVFLLFQHLSLLTQTFQYFFPTIVNTLGYSKIQSLLLTVPVWFLTFLVSLGVTYTSGKSGDRSMHIICLLLISCVGNIIVVSTLNTGARFFAMFLMPLGAVSAYQIIVTWVANSFPRPLVKRSAAIAICNMIGKCYPCFVLAGLTKHQVIRRISMDRTCTHPLMDQDTWLAVLVLQESVWLYVVWHSC